MPKRETSEAVSSVLLDSGPDGTRRACNNSDCLKDYGHEGECTLLTIERACEILNGAAFEGWSCWEAEGGYEGIRRADSDDYIETGRAIAIATGILDRKRVVELEAELNTAYATSGIRSAEQTAARWATELAQVTQERDALQEKVARLQDVKLKEFADSQAYKFMTELAALRLAVEPFLKAARRIQESWQHPGFQRHRQEVAEAAQSVTDADWAALLATEPKNGDTRTDVEIEQRMDELFIED